MRALLTFALMALLLVPAIGRACLWDRDTLAAESDGRMDTINAILGRFDRFPPAFYEARLKRLERELATEPTRLDLWDDAGVAFDRLGRSAEAIAAMEAKRSQLDRLAPDDPVRKEHEYRYLANLGTFHVHRWVKDGADRTNLSDLQEGRRLIAAAIDLNPDAHFGRERYQLFAIDWLLEPPGEESPRMMTLPAEMASELQRVRARGDNVMLKRLGISDAPAGLTGLVVLGAGAESVDLMHTLERVLAAEGRSYVAELAHLRTRELIEAGRKSLDPVVSGFGPEELLAVIESRHYSPIEDQDEVKEWYATARKATDERQAARMRYLEQMLARGEHPDTHPAIWAKAPDGPPLPPMKVGGDSRNPAESGGLVVAVSAIAGAVVLYLISLFRRRRANGAPA
ncbi:hypothetical protein GC173_14595 [bacterium]|nr:hypothetical protein [bacterium]